MKLNFFQKLGYVFFLLMLIIPTSYQMERGAILGLLVISGVIYTITTSNWRLNNEIFALSILCLSTSILFIIYGFLNNAPGALKVTGVFLIWPFIFLFFVGILNKEEDLTPYMKIVIIGIIFSALTAIIYTLEKLGFVNLGITYFYVDIMGKTTGFNSNGGLITHSLPSTTTLIYALPFLVSVLMMPKEYVLFNNKWLMGVKISLFLTLIILLISGRSAFLLAALLSPIISLILLNLTNLKNKIFNKSIKTILLSIVAGIFLILSFDVDLLSIWNSFTAAFNFYDAYNESATLRSKQASILFNDWLEGNIFIGAGHGAASSGITRNEEMPWAYELSYLALLFQTGLVGILIYGGSISWLIIKSILLVRKRPQSGGLIIPLLAGLIGFLITNATNPYLQKFDYLWVLFLTLAALNSQLNNQKKNRFRYGS